MAQFHSDNDDHDDHDHAHDQDDHDQDDQDDQDEHDDQDDQNEHVHDDQQPFNTRYGTKSLSQCNEDEKRKTV